MTRDEYEGFEVDGGPDEEPTESGPCESCGEHSDDLTESYECHACAGDGAVVFDSDRAAERRAMACDLGVGPSDDWRD